MVHPALNYIGIKPLQSAYPFENFKEEIGSEAQFESQNRDIKIPNRLSQVTFAAKTHHERIEMASVQLRQQGN